MKSLKQIFEYNYKEKSVAFMDNYNVRYDIPFEELLRCKNSIKKTREFKKCSSLNIVRSPILKDLKGNFFEMLTMKLEDGVEFLGDCYIHSIYCYESHKEFHDKFSDINFMDLDCKDGCGVSPRVFLKDDKFYKQIFLTLDAEVGEEEFYKQAHEKIDMISKSPKEFILNGTKDIYLRGIFPSLIKDKIKKCYSDNKSELFELEEDKEFLVLYYETNTLNGSINMSIKKKVLPISIKEKYKEELNINIPTTKTQLENFLKKHNLTL